MNQKRKNKLNELEQNKQQRFSNIRKLRNVGRWEKIFKFKMA